MIPLYDTIPRRRFPLVTVALIVANLAAFAYEVRLGEGIDNFLAEHAFIPVLFFHWPGGAADPARWTPILVSMFLHAGVLHLLGNMLFLWIFGDNVEDRCGRLGFLVAYLGFGVVATLAHAIAAPRTGVPMIGASGAIAGVLGAYAVLFPRARVVTFIPLFLFVPLLVEIRAAVFLGLWFVMQIVSAWASAGAAGGEGGIAFWAHTGGFAAGVALGTARRLADRVPA